MTKAVLILLLLVSGTLCQAQQSASAQDAQLDSWWKRTFYQNWSRVYQMGTMDRRIAISDYVFYFVQSDLYGAQQQQ